MAVPKRRTSRSNTRHRRSQWKATAPSLVTCANPACRAQHLPHRACPTCGQYGRAAGGSRFSTSDQRGVVATPLSSTPVEHERLLRVLGVSIDPELLTLALTHRSYAYENGGLPTNERLEFLGDSVLGLVVTDDLYRRFPDLSEGRLAKIRAAVVNMRALAGVAAGLALGQYLLLGRGELSTGGRGKASILADTVEALIGATYLAGGIDAAAGLVHRLIDPLVVDAVQIGAGLDWKTSLQELTSQQELGVPEYRISGTGPDHAKKFAAEVVVAGRAVGSGTGGSKKEAEQIAARMAWAALGGPPGTGGEIE